MGKNHKKKRGSQKRDRNNGSNKRNNGAISMWINPQKNGSSPFPRKMQTNVHTLMSGYIPTTTSASGFFAVRASSLTQPFNSTEPITTAGKITLTGSFNITDQPGGYGDLGTIFDHYKVLGARIKIDFFAGTVPVILNCYPATYEDTSGNLKAAMEQPYAKFNITTAGGPKAVLKVQARSAQVLGLTPRQYEDQPTTAFGSIPATSASWNFNVQWQTQDSVANTGPIYFTIELHQLVEVNSQIAMSS